jgi:hypothetical protein
MHQKALEKLDVLEQILKLGLGDEFLYRALDKLVVYELMKDQEHLRILSHDLAELESKYGLSSEEFFERFQKGQMADTADFMEWNALYKMYCRLQQRLRILQGKGSVEDNNRSQTPVVTTYEI